MSIQRRFYSSQEIIEKIERQEKELSSQKSRLDWTQGFIIAILFICFLAFLGFLYDYFKFTSESRQRFYDKLEQKDKEINTLNFRILENKLQTPLDTIIK